MKIVKKFSLQTLQDFYVLSLTNNFIISNYDNSGIAIFDYSLNVIKNIPLMSGMFIYSVFKNQSKNEIILYCHENQCMIWVDIVHSRYKIISLENYSDDIFSQAYCWHNNHIIFSTYDNKYYMLNLDIQTLENIDSIALEQRCHQCYLIHYYEHKPFLSIITADKTINVNLPDFEYHDVIYDQGLVAFIGETHIQLIHNSNKFIILQPEEHYQFLKAEIIVHNKELNLVALSGNILQPKQSSISIFQVVR